MIRRDYLMGLIEAFLQKLLRIQALKEQKMWNEARATLDEEALQWLGAPLKEAGTWTSEALLLKVMDAQSSIGARERSYMAVSVLAEAGKLAADEGRTDEGRKFHLKALELALASLGWTQAGEIPGFVPTVEHLAATLADGPLPPQIRASLMQHFERTGQYAKAETQLFALVDELPGASGVLELGREFFRRMESKSDHELLAGDLPRDEAQQGSAELEARMGG